MFSLLYSLVLLLALNSATLAAYPIEIIDLKSRPAEEIVPVLRPMLDADGALSASGFQIIIRTSPANLQQIRQLVSQLDTAPRQLMISVFQGSEDELDEASRQFSISYRDRHIRIDAGQDASQPGIHASIKSDNLVLGGSSQSTRINQSDRPLQQLRILEGSSGYIETGQDIPYFSGNVFHRRGRVIVDSGVDYRSVHTGFYVQPRLNGARVLLEISPYRESPGVTGGGVIDTQSASTTVTGRLGQWMEIGGIATDSRSDRQFTGSHYKTRERRNSRLWIRADLVN